MKFFGAILVFLLLGIVCAVLYLSFQSPKADSTWLPEQARTATADIASTMITIHNVRDWTYNESGPLTHDWHDLTVDTTEITRAWFLLEPFSAIKAIGHTFLSFEFADGTVLSFSVEAKREVGEEYSALKGQFNAYELSYQWGTERDFVTRRLIYLDHPLRLYPLELPPEAAQALFRSLAEETNALAGKPRFYNTLLANCTNVLATLVNRHYPGTLPYDLSWNLTGLSDGYLMREGLIATEGRMDTEARDAADLTPYREDIARIATSSPEAFSARIRALLAK